jgi:hypothetical protein
LGPKILISSFSTGGVVLSTVVGLEFGVSAVGAVWELEMGCRVLSNSDGM